MFVSRKTDFKIKKNIKTNYKVRILKSCENIIFNFRKDKNCLRKEMKKMFLILY